ncbi:MAG: hypothetical protein N2560_01945 [Ignavibacteria bacterium]|nr:hypothetical protein [Ignavibacteria bacterium]
MKKIYFFALLILFSCAKEDPNLVNPPPPYKSIRIRLLNAYNSNDFVSWGYNGSQLSNKLGYLEISNAIMPPPFDSINIEFYQNNRKVYTTPRKIRLVRETRYLIISGKSLKEGSDIDTFLILSTTYGLPKKLGMSHFKFVNLVRDSNLKVSIIEGCPNGKPLVSSVSYFNYPYLKTIPYGSYTISIVLNDGNISNFYNTYSLTFLEDREYTLFFAPKKNGSYGLFLYDDYDTTQTSLIELIPKEERVSHLRVVNFSSENISLQRVPTQVLVENLEPKKISKYVNISACQSSNLDSIRVISNTSDNFIGYSFDIFKKYSLFVFDSVYNNKKLLIVPPVIIKEPTVGRSIIRVLNSVDTNFAFTLSLGTRNINNPIGYKSGEILATGLKSNRVSNPILIEPGYLPLTLFSSTEPAFLIKSSFTTIYPDKSYLIVIHKNSSGKIDLSLLLDEQEDSYIEELETGCFVQVLNGFLDLPNLSISFPNYLQNIKIDSKESFATVLPKSIRKILINKVEKEITLDVNKTGLFVIAGYGQDFDFFDISIPSMGNEMGSYRRRFFNASKEIENVGIFYDSAKQKVVVKELNYGEVSNVEKVFLERKFSLVFYDNVKNKMLAQFNDIFLSFGKNYSLVFLGTGKKGFSLIVLQEY